MKKHKQINVTTGHSFRCQSRNFQPNALRNYYTSTSAALWKAFIFLSKKKDGGEQNDYRDWWEQGRLQEIVKGL